MVFFSFSFPSSMDTDLRSCAGETKQGIAFPLSPEIGIKKAKEPLLH